ncbi:MAG: Ku protein [Chloroflexi bacterium]|nr:MAG: Ku protein [Chloroflexota bacterium]TMC57012.1 MAG: Ku protein [Chloroflexota bacterium]TME42110.1 MAG: Ku protein [Chloroflexota bacterium]
MPGGRMRQAVWSGSINFGLVSIPVKLYPATDPKDVRFHLYDRRTGKRVRYERVTREYESPSFASEVPIVAPPTYAPAPREEREAREDLRAPEPVPHEDSRDETIAAARTIEAGDVVRGVELPSGELVTVEEEELASLLPERSRTIDIEEFVDLAEIDPVFFEKSYYVAPQWSSGAEKPYALLLRAMQAAGMVGIGRFVLRTKPHLVAIRPLEKVLGLETLYFGDEVRNPEEIARVPQISVSDRELKMAQQLIGTLATEWVPEKHADEYREGLLELLRAKPATERAPEAEAPMPIADLMAKLKASVEAAKQRTATARKPRSKRAG